MGPYGAGGGKFVRLQHTIVRSHPWRRHLAILPPAQGTVAVPPEATAVPVAPVVDARTQARDALDSVPVAVARAAVVAEVPAGLVAPGQVEVEPVVLVPLVLVVVELVAVAVVKAVVRVLAGRASVAGALVVPVVGPVGPAALVDSGLRAVIGVLPVVGMDPGLVDRVQVGLAGMAIGTSCGTTSGVGT